jgi:hypothetical protein
MVKTIANWVKDNRKPGEELELELLEFGINFYHIVSLLWDRTTRKHTDEFLIYKTREILEILVANVDQTKLDELTMRINKATEVIESIKEENDLFMALGAEIDNHVENGFGVSIEFKLCIVLALLKKRGISMNQILEKYQK